MNKEEMSSILNKISATQNLAGHSFNLFFKEIKWILKKRGFTSMGIIDEGFEDHMRKVDKRDIIIFSPNDKKLKEMSEVKKKVVFPFEKIFIECPMIHFIEDKGILKHTNGFFLDSIKDKENNIKGILFISIWLDYEMNENEEGVTPNIVILPYDKLNKTIVYDERTELNDIAKEIIKNLKKICYLIQSKQYSQYYKWTPTGIVSKEIVYSHEVKSHKRHFWKDSGKFIIPTLPREEILERGYEIDELVFRGYEVRRDVPYKIIDSFKVGADKEKKEDQRIINLLKKRIWRNENKMGLIISKIFTSHFIKQHDRRVIKPLELDFYIHDLKVAFEYDGEQHYDKKVCEEVFKSDFKAQKQRDIRKNALCRRKKITLIRIKYDEPLTVRHIKNKIRASGIDI